MDNKETIQQCALELFYAKGYDGVGVQEIVDRAGITKPTLYYHFGSKKGLLESLLETGYSYMEERVKGAVEKGADLPDTLYHVARAFFDCAIQKRKFYLFMIGLFYSAKENEAYQAVAPFIERYYKSIVDIFEHASTSLGNMNGRQRQFAIGFTGILNHYIMMQNYGTEEGKELEISNETTYAIVHQFMYGIYS